MRWHVDEYGGSGIKNIYIYLGSFQAYGLPLNPYLIRVEQQPRQILKHKTKQTNKQNRNTDTDLFHFIVIFTILYLSYSCISVDFWTTVRL